MGPLTSSFTPFGAQDGLSGPLKVRPCENSSFLKMGIFFGDWAFFLKGNFICRIFLLVFLYFLFLLIQKFSGRFDTSGSMIQIFYPFPKHLKNHGFF